MFLFLDKSLNAAMCLLGQAKTSVLTLLVTVCSSCINPRDLKKGNINNGLVKHHLETNHNFNLKDSVV